jgi:hypothetical protein
MLQGSISGVPAPRFAASGSPSSSLIASSSRVASELWKVKTLDLKEAAAFLRCHPQELRSRAKAGKIPGAKIGLPGSSSRTTWRRTFARAMLLPGKRCK